MNDSEKIQAAEAKLQKLAARLNRGWDILHPLQDKQWEKVREAIAAKWEKKHQQAQDRSTQVKKDRSKRERQKSSKAVSSTKQKSKSQDKDRSQSL
jgi:hypothetical protein